MRLCFFVFFFVCGSGWANANIEVLVAYFCGSIKAAVVLRMQAFLQQQRFLEPLFQ